ncbi:hypothetical protein ECDEC6A_2296 [Escherichia coli DEC6A]|nr:hypothetical protein ECDEC6A_2296 [Escherichia coli DEC6A]
MASLLRAFLLVEKYDSKKFLACLKMAQENQYRTAPLC